MYILNECVIFVVYQFQTDQAIFDVLSSKIFTILCFIFFSIIEIRYLIWSIGSGEMAVSVRCLLCKPKDPHLDPLYSYGSMCL